MSTRELSFKVPGVPRTQGSKKLINGIMIEDNPSLPAWRMSVIKAATTSMRQIGWEMLDEPVGVSAYFYLPRPKQPRFWRPAVKPDLDKLLRAIGDALTIAGVVRDDSRIVLTIAEKRYIDDVDTDPGARIRVFDLREFEQ